MDYTIFFRELSHLPEELDALEKSFYGKPSSEINHRWQDWIKNWRNQLVESGTDLNSISLEMKKINPKYALAGMVCCPGL